MDFESIVNLTALVVYSIFIIRFCLMWVGSDIDGDFDSDIDLDDVISFKGLTHFLMGSSGYLWLKFKYDTVLSGDYLIAFIIGIIFVFVLYYTYKLVSKLETKPFQITKDSLLGKEGYITVKGVKGIKDYEYTVCVYTDFGTTEVSAKSENIYQLGDRVKLINYINNYYII